MKKLIAIVAIAGAALATGVTAAEACGCGGPKPRDCARDGYGYITDMSASSAPKLSCAGAKRVMNKWLDYGWLDDTSSHRLGYNGWLWKCTSYREYMQKRRYHVYCWSGKQAWVPRWKASLPRWTSFTYID